jgi:hypothetical protein
MYKNHELKSNSKYKWNLGNYFIPPLPTNTPVPVYPTGSIILILVDFYTYA